MTHLGGKDKDKNPVGVKKVVINSFYLHKTIKQILVQFFTLPRYYQLVLRNHLNANLANACTMASL